MSTFKGVVAEFPQVRIDYFRPVRAVPPPLACFLSHVHSDHLQGLESLKAPFVYCSPATREILLRLEKYPHRMNFAKGLLETRKQTYRHLKYLLKTLPLDTPTVIELSPGNELRVTLFDANHCAGAVMFLIQGDGKAILYTGDIRSESWWVNSLVQNPILIPYTLGSRRLDCIYLDTTFATKSLWSRDFQSKAEGLKELLGKVEKYPPETIFYFHSWTFGYENVWIALSNFLESPIHLDRYRWSIYKSLSAVQGTPDCREAPPLTGFSLGNHQRSGCLTQDPNVRLHSCEKGFWCSTVESSPDVVHIIPIVTRLENGSEIAEVGAGGGKGDLDQAHELEVGNTNDVAQLMHLCATNISNPDLLSIVLKLLSTTIADSKQRITLEPSTAENGSSETVLLDDLPIKDLIPMLAKGAARQDSHSTPSSENEESLPIQENGLPKMIKFPYSRHSSYRELCELVQAFRPRDIYPCTVDSANWTPELSMRSLFGNLCSDSIFAHDAEMLAAFEERAEEGRKSRANHEETQISVHTDTQASTVENFQQTVEQVKLAQHIAFISPPKLKRKASSLLQQKPSVDTSEIEETVFDSPLQANRSVTTPTRQSLAKRLRGFQRMENLRHPSSSPSRVSPEPPLKRKTPRARIRLSNDGEMYVESIHSSQESDDGQNSQVWTDRQREMISAYFAERDSKAKDENLLAVDGRHPEDVVLSTEIQESDSYTRGGSIARTPHDTTTRGYSRISTTMETMHSSPAPSRPSLASGASDTEARRSRNVETLRRNPVTGSTSKSKGLESTSTTASPASRVSDSTSRNDTSHRPGTSTNPIDIPSSHPRAPTPFNHNPPEPDSSLPRSPTPPTTQIKITTSPHQDADADDEADADAESETDTDSSTLSYPDLGSDSKVRRMAYDAALNRNGLSMEDIQLVSTKRDESSVEL